ncbi:MAG: zinc ribbon domain-containing protein [Polyangiaceae bacterium]|nr:zinc ribbon domain-containing protein [Polyangiaceae bacterium]
MTYEYVCTHCGHEWEAEQRISEQPLRDCPACGQSRARRQITGGQGFLLRGGGWYSDLYGLKSGAKKETTSSSSSGGATGGSGDSKGSSTSTPSKSAVEAA